MRGQRRETYTVILKRINEGVDKYGDSDGAASQTFTIEGAQFEPVFGNKQILERVGQDQAPVVQPAGWNLPGTYDVKAKDLILCGDETWQVVGGGLLWRNRTKVPVIEVREN